MGHAKSAQPGAEAARVGSAGSNLPALRVREGQGQTGQLPDNPVPSHIHGHHAAKPIAEWYFSLDGQAEKDVRAFFRSEAETDKLIRGAFGRILAQEMSPEVSQREGLEVTNVILRGKGGRPWKTLRDAFMYTALLAAHEWTGIKDAYRPEPKDDSPEKPKGDPADDCAALVARKFVEEANTVRNQWPKFRRAALENIKYQEPLIR